MTDYIPDSPTVARGYCPTCEPTADPERELLDLRWCEEHAPDRSGAQDARVQSSAYLSGSADVGGEVNRAWCDLLHRGQAPAAPLEPPPRVIIPPADYGDWA